MSTAAPRPTSPSTRSFGTRQFSNTSSPVSEPRMPSLSSFCAQEKPASVDSIRKAVTPFVPSSGSTVAYTTSTSAVGPLVIQNLVPSRT